MSEVYMKKDKDIRLMNLNQIPVRTWRWLGVNDISLDETFPGKVPYNKDIFQYSDPGIPQGQGKIYPIEEAMKSLECISKLNQWENDINKNISGYNQTINKYDGLSNDLTDYIRDNYNTGFYLGTKPGQKLSNPLRITYSFDRDDRVVIDKNIIVAEEGSEVTILINYQSSEINDRNSLQDGPAISDGMEEFHYGLTTIYGKKGSTITVVKIQSLSDYSTHLDGCIARLEEDAKLNYIQIELGAKHSVSNVRTDLKGNKSSVGLHTVYIGDGDRNIDMNYVANHYGKQTRSIIEAKGALMDQCSKTFRGTLDFKKGASNSIGQEEEYAILLSDKVRNRSIPLLLCTEDDVEGQHAASAGKIDENKLFYLMTRGFSEVEAKRLIIEASIRPILDLIPDQETKGRIEDGIRRKLVYGK